FPQDWLEDRLLSQLQSEVLKPEVIDYVVQEFGRQLESALQNLSGETARMREQKEKLESELRRLTAAIAEQGHSSFLLAAIAEREGKLREITDRLLSGGGGSVEAQVADIRRFVTERLSDLRKLLYSDVALARAELGKHVSEIRMEPDLTERHYVAKGQWNLLGGYPKTDVRIGLVAGACCVAFHNALAAYLVRSWSLPRNGRRRLNRR